MGHKLELHSMLLARRNHMVGREPHRTGESLGNLRSHARQEVSNLPHTGRTQSQSSSGPVPQDQSPRS